MIQAKENIVGYTVDTIGVSACVSVVIDWIRIKNCISNSPVLFRWLACMNPHSFAVALKDDIYSNALSDADWLIPDGSGVVLASKILGGQIQERVTGSDIFKGVMDGLNEIGCFKVLLPRLYPRNTCRD